MKLPLNYEPCDDHKAKLMAKEMVNNRDWENYDAAYESAWDIVEEENK